MWLAAPRARAAWQGLHHGRPKQVDFDLTSFAIFIPFPCLQIHQEVLAKGRAHIVWIIKVYKTFVILSVVVFKCFLTGDQMIDKACLSATALPSGTLTLTSASPSETFRPGCNLFSLFNLFLSSVCCSPLVPFGWFHFDSYYYSSSFHLFYWCFLFSSCMLMFFGGCHFFCCSFFQLMSGLLVASWLKCCLVKCCFLETIISTN